MKCSIRWIYTCNMLLINNQWILLKWTGAHHWWTPSSSWKETLPSPHTITYFLIDSMVNVPSSLKFNKYTIVHTHTHWTNHESSLPTRVYTIWYQSIACLTITALLVRRIICETRNVQVGKRPVNMDTTLLSCWGRPKYPDDRYLPHRTA